MSQEQEHKTKEVLLLSKKEVLLPRRGLTRSGAGSDRARIREGIRLSGRIRDEIQIRGQIRSRQYPVNPRRGPNIGIFSYWISGN